VGKTILLQNLARGIHANHPEADLYLLLIDERPEEVTDMTRNVPGHVYASSNDNDTKQHLELAEIATERFKRMVEAGRNVVVLMDSLTRLGRAFNVASRSGKTLSGGIDSRALEMPKKIFGAARKIENGGSLTILATCLVDTNSRMDDVIFEEFKGTGNMELVMDRRLSNDRIFPAINIPATGTRKEELLIPEQWIPAVRNIRRHLANMHPVQAMKILLEAIRKHPNNESFLKAMTPQQPAAARR
jgi:transcription termination factor Rho